MTTRTFTHPNPGPITLRVDTTSTDIRVSIGEVTHATLTLATDATSGPVHDAVTSASVEHGHAVMTLDLDDTSAGSGITIVNGGNVISTGGGSGVVVTGSVRGGVSIVDGRVFIGGKEVTPNAGEQGGTLTLTATLPFGSSLDAHTGSGEIHAIGSYAAVSAGTSSGGIRIERARAADVAASSGSIRVKQARTLHAHASSGSIRVDYAEDVTASASSGSITIEHVRGQANLSASSGSIDVCYSGPKPRVHTTSGSKCVRQINPFVQDTPDWPEPVRAEPEDAVPAGYERRAEPEDAQPKRQASTPWWRQ